MVSPRGRPDQTIRPGEKRGRVQLRDVGRDPADVPNAEVSSGGNELDEITALAKRARSSFTWPGTTIQETVTLSTVSAVKSLPNVVITGIPADATIRFARAVFLYREVSDTSAALNDLNAACGANIQVRLSGGTFTDAIDLVDQQFQVPASERGPGDVLFGDIDLTCEVTGDGTYNFQFEAVVSTGSSLILRDVQVALQVMWS